MFSHVGLDKSNIKVELDDIKLMRLARLLHHEHLMILSANLVGNVQFLENLEHQYCGFGPSVHAFMIFHEWKKLIKNRGQAPTAGMLLYIFENEQIDKHHLCMVRVIYFLVSYTLYCSFICHNSTILLKD